jgi:hypothetical protein
VQRAERLLHAPESFYRCAVRPGLRKQLQQVPKLLHVNSRSVEAFWKVHARRRLDIVAHLLGRGGKRLDERALTGVHAQRKPPPSAMRAGGLQRVRLQPLQPFNQSSLSLGVLRHEREPHARDCTRRGCHPQLRVSELRERHVHITGPAQRTADAANRLCHRSPLVLWNAGEGQGEDRTQATCGNAGVVNRVGIAIANTRQVTEQYVEIRLERPI